MRKVPVSRGMRIFWAFSFVIGVIATGIGVAFLLSGPDMIVPTMIFGIPGVFIVLESFGRMLGWEK